MVWGGMPMSMPAGVSEKKGLRKSGKISRRLPKRLGRSGALSNEIKSYWHFPEPAKSDCGMKGISLPFHDSGLRIAFLLLNFLLTHKFETL